MAKASLRERRATPVSSTLDESTTVPVVSTSPPRKRRPSWVLAGVVMVVFAALIGVYALRAVTDEMSVMVAAQDLEPGVPISASDLRVVTMGQAGNLRAIQPDQQDLIVGQAPRFPIPAGTVLNTGLFVEPDAAVPEGRVVVGAAFAAGEVPTPGLAAGDRVELITVAPAAVGSVGAAPPAAVVVGEATVWGVSGSANAEGASARVWVSLLVDADLQTVVAQAASDGLLRLSLVGL